jgi:YidC/Oxa1 family membrane protein insertase
MVVDPSQKMMTLMMPIVMTFVFFSFPSGLVLYWLTNNVLMIVQKMLMKPSPIAQAS